MNNFLNKIFGNNKSDQHSSKTFADQKTLEEININTEKLWKLLEGTIDYYNSISCPCSFPRFFQYTSIDCSETHNSFYMSETEGLIYYSNKNFIIKEIDKGQECHKALYTCRKCSSIYEYGWSDFSIHVSRTYLKPLQIKAKRIGANPTHPILFFVGLFGHSYPDQTLFIKVEFEIFKKYLQEIENGA